MRLELKRYLQNREKASELNRFHALETIDQEVIKDAMDAAVSFQYKDETGKVRTYFTGVHIGNGNVLTVRHGLEDNEGWELVGRSYTGESFNNIDLVQIGENVDLALLHSDELEAYPLATLSTSPNPEPPNTLFVVNFTESVSNAFRVRFAMNKFSRHTPINGNIFAFEDHIDTDVVLNTVKQGTSGSGVFNIFGEIEGIVYSGYVDNKALAIDRNGIKDFLNNS